HWSFRPLREPKTPLVKNWAWVRTPVDAFVLARLEARKLKPAPPADRRTLIRLATFDLIGLPPTPSEVDAFLADSAPGAFARVVDRLLASPHYGERWGRHWLDVARYADSNGLDENVAHANAWRYRDYVVSSFNRDKPYDQFLLEQLAGDLLPAVEDVPTRHERLTATGFLVLGPKVLAEVDSKKMEMDIVDEQVDTVGRAVMGLTLGCARCHDHKFDPITTEDYYALAGVFKSTRSMVNFTKPAQWHENSLATDGDKARLAAHTKQVADAKTAIASMVAAAKAIVPAPAPGAAPPKDEEALFPEATRAELKRRREELARLEASPPELPSAMGVTEGTVADVPVHVRGSHLALGKQVARRFPVVLAGEQQAPLEAKQSGRLQLARWLVGKEHPLTSRVMANRIWRWHFGQGLSRSTDNFGRLGEPPTDPALLDWLAVRFMKVGWSLKKMHRLLMLSSTYAMSSAHDPRAASVDPENRLHWRAEVRRLEAEAVRDALLAVSGTLDRTMGGSLLTLKNREFVFDHTSRDATRYDSLRRSIYLPVIRNNVYDVFQLFDFADPAVLEGNRPTTTVAPQALFMMNSDLVHGAAEAMADRLLERGELDDPGRIRLLYLQAYARP
ncbi:MAG TPA: DUF1549 and DUF1553 domain-containing protein, partial [Armatimonadota bacterium]|nr:DUF1549 and DUF1553 domain-containing protein [Armatimonadota bacterium]